MPENSLAKIPSIIKKLILFVSLKKLFIIFFSKLYERSWIEIPLLRIKLKSFLNS